MKKLRMTTKIYQC